MNLSGHCLIASPYLEDSHFYRSVILLIAHSSEGAMGLILNRPTDHSLGKVFQSITSKQVVREGCVYHGGPVEGPLMALHNISSLSDRECLSGVYFSSSAPHLRQLSTLSHAKLRVFNGYSGWSPNQLEEEIERGGWLLSQLGESEIFGEISDLWGCSIRKIGNSILAENLGHSPPTDPQVN